MTLIWCAGRGRVTLASAPLADWHCPLACRVVLRLGSHHDAGDVAREAFGLTSDAAYLAGMLSTGASIAVWTASSRMGNAPRARPATTVTRLPILMPAPRCSGPWRRSPHLKYRRGGTVTSLTSRCLPPILAEIPFPAARRPDTGWQEAAICRQADPELFFPIGTTGAAVAEIQQAKAVCARCPVRRPCLAYALATRQEFGIWGGRDENERRLLHRQWRDPASLPAPNPHSPEPGGR